MEIPSEGGFESSRPATTGVVVVMLGFITRQREREGTQLNLTWFQIFFVLFIHYSIFYISSNFKFNSFPFLFQIVIQFNSNFQILTHTSPCFIFPHATGFTERERERGHGHFAPGPNKRRPNPYDHIGVLHQTRPPRIIVWLQGLLLDFESWCSLNS